MDNESRFSMPIKLVVFDTVGMILIGLGIAKLQVNLDVLPENLRFPYSGWVFVLAGIALMAPLFMHVIKFALNKDQ